MKVQRIVEFRLVRSQWEPWREHFEVSRRFAVRKNRTDKPCSTAGTLQMFRRDDEGRLAGRSQ